MKKIIKLHDIEYKINSIYDINLHDRTILINTINNDDISETDKATLILSILTDIPHDIISEFKDIFKIDFTDILTEPIPTITNLNIHYDDNIYSPILFSELTVTQFITMETLLSNNDIETFLVISYFNNADITTNINELKKYITMINAGVAQTVINNFAYSLKSFYKLYEDLFNIKDIDVEEDKTEDTDESETITPADYGIMGFVYTVAGDNFLSIPDLKNSNLFEFFEYLGWKKYINDINKDKIRK